MGKLFKTGWQRKPRDKDGNIVNVAEEDKESTDVKKDDGEVKIQTIVVNGAAAAAAAAKATDAATAATTTSGES